MDKVMIYVRSFEELKDFVVSLNKLKNSGIEVAFCTDVDPIVRFLSAQKQLIVAFGTYECDAVIVHTKRIKVDQPILTLKELEEVINDE